MPPYSSKIYGSLQVYEASNPSLHGVGSMDVYRDVNLTHGSLPQYVKTSTTDLHLESAANEFNTALNGNLSLSATSTASSGKLIVSCTDATSGGASLNLGGYGLNCSSVGPVTMNSTSNSATVQALNDVTLLATNVNSTASNSSLLQATQAFEARSTASTAKVAAQTGVEVSTALGPIDILTADPASVTTIQGGTATGKVSLDAQRLELGVLSAETIQIGKSSTVTTVPGSLIVNGTTTSVNTTTTEISDNLLVLHSTPASLGKDAGILLNRYPDDVVSHTPEETGTLLGSSSTSFTVPVSAQNTADDYYKCWYVKISNDNPVGSIGQVRKVLSYVGATQICTIDAPWAVIPGPASTYELFNKSSASVFYHEGNDQLTLAYSTCDDVNSHVVHSGYMELRCKGVVIDDPIVMPGFQTITVDIPCDSSTPVVLPGLKLRGAYYITFESVEDGGSVGSIFITKNQASGTSFQLMGVSSPASSGSDEQLDVKWDVASQAPAVFHSTLRTGATPGQLLSYNVKYLTA